MFRKLFGIFMAAMLVFGFAGQSFALFENLELVRVVYHRTGATEMATDLGNVSTLAAGSNVTVGGGAGAFELSDFAGASWNNLYVAYYAKNVGLQYDAWTSGPLTGQASGAAKIGQFTSAADPIAAYYQELTATGGTVTGAQSDLRSYWTKFDTSGTGAGTFSGFIPLANGEANLTDLATIGYVDQKLYKYDFSSPANPASAGVAIATIRTMADGSTIINPGAVVPVPPSLILLGSGLLGLIGLRRRAS